MLDITGSDSGLGLAMVTAIIAAHGGALGVTSIVGKGGAFYFDLPVAALA